MVGHAASRGVPGYRGAPGCDVIRALLILAAVAAAVIAVRENLDVDGALAWVQQRKPSADPLPHQRDDLLRWWRARSAPDPR